jgi:hypothetical protein
VLRAWGSAGEVRSPKVPVAEPIRGVHCSHIQAGVFTFLIPEGHTMIFTVGMIFFFTEGRTEIHGTQVAWQERGASPLPFCLFSFLPTHWRDEIP